MRELEMKSMQAVLILSVLSMSLMMGCTLQEDSKVIAPDSEALQAVEQAGGPTAGDSNTEEVTGRARTDYYDALRLEMEAVAEHVAERLETQGSVLDKQACMRIIEMEKTEDVEYIYLGFSDDTFMVVPSLEMPEDYAPSQRPWFKGALDGQVFTDIYQDAFTSAYICTTSVMVCDDQEQPVVLGMDFVLEDNPDYFEAAHQYMTALNPPQAETLSMTDSKEEEGQALGEEEIAAWSEALESLGTTLSPYEAAQDMRQEFFDFMQENPQVGAAYLAAPDGRLIASDDMELPEGYDPRTRPWYQAALDTEDVYVAAPYFDIISEAYIHSIFIEIESAPEPGWVLGVDIMEE